MELKQEPVKFEELQALFIGEMVDKVRIKLLEAGMEGELLRDTTANIAFSLASTLDDTSLIEANGVEVHPFLTFRGEGEELIHCGENAYTYEHVYGILNKMFNEGE